MSELSKIANQSAFLVKQFLFSVVFFLCFWLLVAWSLTCSPASMGNKNDVWWALDLCWEGLWPVCPVHSATTFTIHLPESYTTFTLYLHHIHHSFTRVTSHLPYTYTTFTTHLPDSYITFTSHLHHVHTTFTTHCWPVQTAEPLAGSQEQVRVALAMAHWQWRGVAGAEQRKYPWSRVNCHEVVEVSDRAWCRAFTAIICLSYQGGKSCFSTITSLSRSWKQWEKDQMAWIERTGHFQKV